MDSNFKDYVLKFEHFLLRRLGVKPKVINILKRDIDYYVKTRKGLIFKRRGTRKTGDQTTSLCNTLVNYVLLQRIMWQQLGASYWSWANGLFQGDDRLAILPGWISYDIDLHNQHSAEWGFPLRFATITDDIAEIDYCSRVFWPTETKLGYSLGPKIGKVLNKSGWSRTYQRNSYKWLRANALGLQKSVHFIPALRHYVDKILQLTKGYEADPNINWYSIRSDEFHNPRFEPDYISRLNNIPYDDILQLIRKIESVKSLPCVINHPSVFKLALDDR